MEKRAKILIVDDTTENIDILIELLEDKYSLFVATSGFEAMKLVNSNPNFDLILLDIVMPEMSGYQVCEKLKLSKKQKDIPVIFLTSQNDIDHLKKGFEVGAVDYIVKPFNPFELVARVETHIGLKKAKEDITILLNKTLVGVNKVFIDMMSLSNPFLFTRASRLSNYMKKFIAHYQLEDSWKFQLAALYSQLGLVFLDSDTALKICYNRELSTEDQIKKQESDKIGKKLLEDIPKLEAVSKMIPGDDFIPDSEIIINEATTEDIGKNILSMLLTYDKLVLAGRTRVEAITELRQDYYSFNPILILDLSKCIEEIELRTNRLKIELSFLDEGMILDEDLENVEGVLILKKGTEISASLKNKVRVMIKSGTLENNEIRIIDQS